MFLLIFAYFGTIFADFEIRFADFERRQKNFRQSISIKKTSLLCSGAQRFQEPLRPGDEGGMREFCKRKPPGSGGMAFGRFVRQLLSAAEYGMRLSSASLLSLRKTVVEYSFSTYDRRLALLYLKIHKMQPNTLYYTF